MTKPLSEMTVEELTARRWRLILKYRSGARLTLTQVSNGNRFMDEVDAELARREKEERG